MLKISTTNDTRCWKPDDRCTMLDIGCSMIAAGYRRINGVKNLAQGIQCTVFGAEFREEKGEEFDWIDWNRFHIVIKAAIFKHGLLRFKCCIHRRVAKSAEPLYFSFAGNLPCHSLSDGMSPANENLQALRAVFT
jgi:hypothetical protein